MKNKVLVAAVAIAVSLSAVGCGGSPAASQKSSELSAAYEYYEKSADNIQKYMDVTADQADDIFVILQSCGVEDVVNIITKNGDGTFATWSAGTEYTVSLKDGAVDTVYLDEDQIYPKNIHHNDLMDYELIEKDVMNGSGDTVIGQYAYISITASQLEEMTAENLREFAESRVAGSSYNWVSIIATDGNGICFASSDTSFATYGKLNKDGSIAETIGTWTLEDDGNYKYSE